MDSITQAALGAAIGESMFGKKVGAKASVAGAAIASLPDLDVILYLLYDKLEMLSIHRGLSHSIVFSILGAFLLAFILSKIKGFRKIEFRRLLTFSWLALFTHMLLDTFTAYGTQLLLPFSDSRLSLDSINVVDPVYTLPLLIGLFLSLRKKTSNPNRSTFNNYGLIISSIYLMLTLFHKQIVETNIENRLQQNTIAYQSLLTMPVGSGNIRWYGVAKTTDSIFMLQYHLFKDAPKEPESFPINDELLDLINPEVAAIMRWFAKGFYTVEEQNGKIRIYNLQVDMRGVISNDSLHAPTAGYFEVEIANGGTNFSSGSHK